MLLNLFISFAVGAATLVAVIHFAGLDFNLDG